MKLKREFIEKLPKTDLHVHLDGSLRISTIFELAKEQNVTLPADNEDDLKKIVCCGKDCKNLDEYLKAFEVTRRCCKREYPLHGSTLFTNSAHTERIKANYYLGCCPEWFGKGRKRVQYKNRCNNMWDQKYGPGYFFETCRTCRCL
jgi:hypothetical protein